MIHSQKIHNNLLIHDDCMHAMQFLEKESIDAVIADIPYGILKSDWDVPLNFCDMWAHLNRVIKKNGVMILFGSEPFASHLRISNLKQYRHEWIWQKDKGANFLQSNFQPLKVHENIMIFANGKTTYNPQKTQNNQKLKSQKVINNNEKRFKSGLDVKQFKNSNSYEIDKLMPRSVLYFARDNNSKLCLHPTQKPIALMEYLVKTYTNKNDVILDHTMGSGSTGVACQNLNRKFIGIEKNKEYFNIAKDRLKVLQITLDF